MLSIHYSTEPASFLVKQSHASHHCSKVLDSDPYNNQGLQAFHTCLNYNDLGLLVPPGWYMPSLESGKTLSTKKCSVGVMFLYCVKMCLSHSLPV